MYDVRAMSVSQIKWNSKTGLNCIVNEHKHGPCENEWKTNESANYTYLNVSYPRAMFGSQITENGYTVFT